MSRTVCDKKKITDEDMENGIFYLLCYKEMMGHTLIDCRGCVQNEEESQETPIRGD